MTGSERRGIKRFGLQIPTMIMSTDPARQTEKLCLLSRDLSGYGGFFIGQKDLSLDSLVDLRIILDFNTSCGAESERYSVIEVEGKVLRTEREGVAIRFDGKFKISPIDSA